MSCCFSATGNCKYVAQQVANEFNDKAVSIEEHNGKIVLSENEMLGFVCPVNWFGLPVLIREFMKKINIENIPFYSFIVTTYGSTSGFTYVDAKKILAKKGIKLTAGFSVKMVDNWTPLFDVSDPQRVAQQNEDSKKYIADIIQLIRVKASGNRMQNKMPYFVRIIADFFLNSQRKTKKFYVEDSCIGCGLCANRCPVQAIEIKEKKPKWTKELCALCLRCLHHCPKFAIQYGDGTTKKHGQYCNPNVSC